MRGQDTTLTDSLLNWKAVAMLTLEVRSLYISYIYSFPNLRRNVFLEQFIKKDAVVDYVKSFLSIQCCQEENFLHPFCIHMCLRYQQSSHGGGETGGKTKLLRRYIRDWIYNFFQKCMFK